jgi:hypothetical protein
MQFLMKEGMQVYDAKDGLEHPSHLFLPLVCADGPAMTALDGGVGHSGALGCWLKCPFKGRHKPKGSHYYPALQRPNNYNVEGCSHVDQAPEGVAEWRSDQTTRDGYLKALAELL